MRLDDAMILHFTSRRRVPGDIFHDFRARFHCFNGAHNAQVYSFSMKAVDYTLPLRFPRKHFSAFSPLNIIDGPHSSPSARHFS